MPYQAVAVGVDALKCPNCSSPPTAAAGNPRAPCSSGT